MFKTSKSIVDDDDDNDDDSSIYLEFASGHFQMMCLLPQYLKKYLVNMDEYYAS